MLQADVGGIEPADDRLEPEELVGKVAIGVAVGYVKQLLDSGALTPGEYEALKAHALGTSAPAATTAPATTRSAV